MGRPRVSFCAPLHQQKHLGKSCLLRSSSCPSKRMKGVTAMGEKRSSSPVRQAKIWGDTCTSQMKTYKTAAGTLLLRKCCPPSLVERSRADEGLRAFGRLPEREHHLVVGIAQRSDRLLTLADTFSGELVRHGTLAAAISWWARIPDTYDCGVEGRARLRDLA